MRWTYAIGAQLPDPGRPVENGGFTETRLQHNSWRLTWPHGGLGGSVHIAFWGNRYAATMRTSQFAVIDAQRPQVAQLRLIGLGLELWPAYERDRQLWVRARNGYLLVPCEDLEGLVERPDGPLDLRIETTYPLRDINLRVPGVIRELGAHVSVTTAQREISVWLGEALDDAALEVGMSVMLCDRLCPPFPDGMFTRLEIVGREPVELEQPIEPRTVGTLLTHVTPQNPSATHAAAAAPARTSELRSLLLELASTDDDATRGIIIDVLAEAGQPCATAFAKLRGGRELDRNLRKAALGPLSQFLRDFEFRGGLPWSAILERRLPESVELRAEFLADVRLGMLARIRAGNGSTHELAKLLASGAFIGLRRIEASKPVLDALIVLRQPLSHLHEVYYEEVGHYFANPVLDSVHWIEFQTGMPVIERQLELLVKDVNLRRAPRHFSFVASNLERTRFLVPLIRAALPDLPCTGVTIGDVTL